MLKLNDSDIDICWNFIE